MKKAYLFALMLSLTASQTWSADSQMASNIQEIRISLDSIWVVLGGILVFFMQAGFAMIESGSVRSKNTVNVLMKNYMDACLGGLGVLVSRFWFDVWCKQYGVVRFKSFRT